MLSSLPQGIIKEIIQEMIPDFFFKRDYLDGESPVSTEYNEKRKTYHKTIIILHFRTPAPNKDPVSFQRGEITFKDQKLEWHHIVQRNTGGKRGGSPSIFY